MKLSLVLVATTLALTTTDAAVKYKQCTESERMSIFGGINNELQSCASSSTYDITGKTLPTSDQRQTICKCTDLVKRMSDLSYPRCNLVLDGSVLSFKGAIASIFTECGIPEPKEVPETSPPPGTNTTDDGVASDATPPPTKSNSTVKPIKDSSSSGSGAGLTPIKTPKPTTKAPKPTTVRPEDSGSEGSSAMAPTPTPTPESSGRSSVGTMTSAAVALVALCTTFASL